MTCLYYVLSSLNMGIYSRQCILTFSILNRIYYYYFFTLNLISSPGTSKTSSVYSKFSQSSTTIT